MRRGRRAEAGATRQPRRGRWSLIAGAAMLALLVAGNVASYLVTEPPSRASVRTEPSHLPLLQRLLWKRAATDTLISVGMDMGARTDSVSAPLFQSVPLVTARVGRPYEYRPQAATHLSDFTIQGQPDSLTIDARTGRVSGTPTTIGTYPVILGAQFDANRRAQQHFTLFVDDRYLLLGSDGHGRDVFKRLLTTLRFTLVPGLIAVVVSLVGGTLLGAYGGYYAGPTRVALEGMTTILQSVPGLLLIFLAAVISEFNTSVVMVVVGLIMLPETAQGVLERVKAFRERDFVEAARELGMRDRTILWNEIVWHNARPFLLTRLMQGFVYALLIEVTLSYMRLSDPNSARLGTLLLEGRTEWFNGASSALAIAPLAVLLLIVAAFTLVERGILGRWSRR